jgi:hypothetical protein
VVGENVILGHQSYAITARLPASLGLLKIMYHSSGGYRGVCHVGSRFGISSFYIGLAGVLMGYLLSINLGLLWDLVAYGIQSKGKVRLSWSLGCNI